MMKMNNYVDAVRFNFNNLRSYCDVRLELIGANE
jgi:hypothetical protein